MAFRHGIFLAPVSLILLNSGIYMEGLGKILILVLRSRTQSSFNACLLHGTWNAANKLKAVDDGRKEAGITNSYFRATASNTSWLIITGSQGFEVTFTKWSNLAYVSSKTSSNFRERFV